MCKENFRNGLEEKSQLTIWVPNICNKFHFRRPERVIFGKRQMSFKHTTFTVKRQRNEYHFVKIINKGFLKTFLDCVSAGKFT